MEKKILIRLLRLCGYNLFAWGFALAFVILFVSCRSGEALDDPPIITSATYQHTLYNGLPQPIEARAAEKTAPAVPFIITYFPSLEALERNKGGTAEIPREVGNYFVRIERPAGNGYAAGPSVTVEYAIQKALTAIIAAENQRAVYDGTPKEVTARSEPPLPLELRYYTDSNHAPTSLLPGPPSEPGTYYVRVEAAGGRNHMGASRDIVFRITD